MNQRSNTDSHILVIFVILTSLFLTYLFYTVKTIVFYENIISSNSLNVIIIASKSYSFYFPYKKTTEKINILFLVLFIVKYIYSHCFQYY